jgi:hypothetical protein
METLHCSRQLYFVNHPKELFKASDECEATKKFFESEEKCGEKFGEIYIVEDNFWKKG